MFETIFSLSTAAVVPFWALIILLPRWRVTRFIMSSPLVIVPAAVLYAIVVLPRVGELIDSFDSAASLAALLGTPAGATLAWAHFLTSDLFIGRWEYLDSRERGISGWVMAPVLVLQFMLGHLAILIYLVLRVVLRARAAGSESVSSPRGARSDGF